VILDAAPVALLSALAFGGVVLMTDRKRGANVAWAVLLVGAVLAFLAIIAGPVAGISPRQIAGLAAGLLAAGAAGMLYHFFLGRFAQIWTARGALSAVFLGLWLAFGLALPAFPD
jgi:hypothetical protein